MGLNAEGNEVIAFDAGRVSDLVERMFSQSTVLVDVVRRESFAGPGEVVEFHLGSPALSINEQSLWKFVEGLAGREGLPLGWAGEPLAILLVEAFAARMKVDNQEVGA